LSAATIFEVTVEDDMTDDEVEVKEFGAYIVADPRICHGQLTFRGTRILVEVVLQQVARGMDWDEIVGE
jgi:uncharacterized protein (DUF433 family)